MAQPRRLNTPLYSPVPSLAAANQSQIDDLVQRNRTLDAMHKKLLEEVKQERERHKTELLKLREEQAQAQEEWRRSTYDLLIICEIHNKHVKLELAEEKKKVTQGWIGIREEKLGRMVVDYKRKLWEMQAQELEAQVTRLEEEKYELEQDSREDADYLRHEYEEAEGRLRDAQAELKQLTKARDALQAKYHKLSEELATSKASNSTLNGELKRLKLTLDGELEKNEELKRSQVKLQQQIDEWKNLEKREGAEVDSERKRRVALGVELEMLQSKHKEEMERLESALEKERQKCQKWKDAVDEWQESAKGTEKELKESEKQVTKLQKQVDKLKEDLEAERARVRPPSPTRISKPHTAPEEDAEEDAPPPRKPRISTAKPASKQRRKAQVSEAEGEGGTSKPASKSRKESANAKKKKAIEPEPNDEEEHADDESDGQEPEEVVEVNKKGKKPASKSDTAKPKRKRKEPADEPDVEEVPKQKTKAKAKPAKAAPAPVPVDENDEDEAPAKATKKRKINRQPGIFPKVDPFNFGLGGLDFGMGDGLDIPSTLSPVRPDAVPPRFNNTASAARRW